jgi:hypothetical protein
MNGDTHYVQCFLCVSVRGSGAVGEGVCGVFGDYDDDDDDAAAKMT